MIFDVVHTTRYDYAGTATLCHSEARLLPRSFESQTSLSSRIDVAPRPAALDGRVDHFGNQTTYFSIQEPHDSLEVTASSRVKVLSREIPPAAGVTWEDARNSVVADTTPAALTAREFRLASKHVPRASSLAAFAETSFIPGRDVVEALLDLNTRIHDTFEYVPGYTDISTPLDQLVEDQKGVCQDFAHFAIGCIRWVGLPARYVSGYIETVPPPGRERVQGADASHAWFSAYVPGLGWVDLDPTNDVIVSNQHITVAWGRDFSDATPLKGVVSGGGAHSVLVSVDVVRDDDAVDA